VNRADFLFNTGNLQGRQLARTASWPEPGSYIRNNLIVESGEFVDTHQRRGIVWT
jgi:hypothetical protein